MKSTVKISLALLSALVALWVPFGTLAQQPAAPDPLMSLLLSQPKMALDAPVNAAVVWDPPAVRPGQSAVYHVTFNAMEEAIEMPENLPGLPPDQVRAGAHGQILSMMGTNMEVRTSFLFHTTPKAVGTITIPSYTVQVYGKPVKVPQAVLPVLPLATPVYAQRLFVELPVTNVYMGQAVRPRVILPFSHANIQTLSQAQLTGKGFLVDQSAVRQRIESLSRGGSNAVSYIYEPLVTPISPGRVSFIAQGWSVVNRATGQVIITNNTILNLQVFHTLLDSDPVELNVRPLPSAGQLPGFTGAVGVFTNDPPRISGALLKVGEPLKMKVTIRGEGNVARMVPPPAPSTPDWQIFEASGDPTSPQILNAQGAITFTYTMIPLTPAIRATPPIPFSVFNPKIGQYVDLTIPSVGVKVETGDVAVDRGVLEKAVQDRPRTNAEPTLSGLATSPGLTGSLQPVQLRAWFPIVQLAPALFFGGLWWWDRRRKYLEKHPEVVRCRKARRELRIKRRKLRQAAGLSNSRRVAELGVDAMRVAGAPHYPAEPRALVGRDIIELLSEPRRSGKGGETVRRFFSAIDAAEFSGEAVEPKELLSHVSELESVLDELDAHLRQPGVGTSTPSGVRVAVSIALLMLGTFAQAVPFDEGLKAFSQGNYLAANVAFSKAAMEQPATGTFQNQGLAQWQLGRTGDAVLSWERGLWLNPFSSSVRQNLAYARRTAQLEAPELAWYEVISSCLPFNAWPWITGCSLWLAVGVVLLPVVLGQRKAGWHQAVAAFALMLFLLSVPALYGVYTRSLRGFVLEKDTPLRLTPTSEAQIIGRLAPGEPVRRVKSRGPYLFVRTSHFNGWIEQSKLGFVCPRW